MILVCPYCGHSTYEPLIEGLASCRTCQRVYDSSLVSNLLSAFWLLKNNNYHGIEQLMSDTKLKEHEAIFVYSFANDSSYSYQEFVQVLKDLGIMG